MKARLIISSVLVALGCAWVGCAQPRTGRSAPQQVHSSNQRDEESVGDSSAEVVTASYTPSVGAAAGPRVTLRRQLVLFSNHTDVEAILQGLWGDIPADPDSPRSQIVATDEILATLQPHLATRAVGLRPEVSTVIASGAASSWKDENQPDYQWRVTPTVEASDVIQVSISGQPGALSIGSKNENILKVAATSELRPGQSLMIEGLDCKRGSAEVTRVPVLSDLPVVGDRLFSKVKTTVITMKTLYLVSAEIAAEPDAEEE
ncbi:MAG: hypothetical protein JSS49_09445 [Planctomycetes bacterium]|nr:hypothetical protein [Planctomycetota bacterium]